MIPKEEASCIFYCKEYTEDNAKVCLLNLEKSPDVILCYIHNPNDPLLICSRRVFGSPHLYKLYKSKKEIAKTRTSNNINKSNIVLENESQLVDFINYLFRPKEEYISDPRYRLISVYDKDILSIVWKYSHKFDQKTPLGFSKWLNSQKVDLTLTEPERKSIKIKEKEIKLRSRQLYVLEDEYHDSVVKDIVEVLPKHQQVIKEIKKEGYQVIGYCRKSAGDTKNRVSSLQRMVDIMYKRSLVDKVFVSPLSSAKQKFSKRDLKDVNQILSQLNNIHGSTVDFLEFLKNNPRICIISIDYAGFTTDCTELKQLLR
ncbi:hypothetical protein BDB01DRAFT_188594 [Pilobolus umbonatus]|nr:hypothetical protein BDB01DRAFT_188594 [Pilobolus umbonatus]